MSLAAPVTSYAHRFARVHRAEHLVSSPLGAWLVMALGVQAATGATRAEVEGFLGLDAGAARTALDDLLRQPPNAVRAALAAWTRERHPWIDGLPSAVAKGSVPSAPALDAWASEHTDGLINEFPVSDPASVEVLLASALATRVSWLRPFALAGAEELRSPWSRRVTEVLVDREPDAALVDTAVGTVAVHTAAADGLRVTSVIADAAAAPQDVLALAHDIATGPPLRRAPLADRPLGEHGHYAVTEELRAGGDAHLAFLPAWEVTSDHDLMADPELGFGAVGRALAEGTGKPVDARQVAVARYGQYGFEAAAITSVAVRSAFIRPTRVRVATLRFGHPYAVVAVADAKGPWAGLPVFAAWVAEPSEPAAVVTGR